MASDKGFTSKQRATENLPTQDHVTAQPVRQNQFAKDVLSHSFAREVGTDIVEANSTTMVINASAHSAQVGDIINFTSGNLIGVEAKVISVDTNTITLGETLSEAPALSDEFQILRHKTPLANPDGSLPIIATPAPIRYVLDGADQIVTEDTVDSSNNRPLPVKLTEFAGGDINITAGDLNVQLSHNATNPDSVQIGDGSEILLITASGQAETFDSVTHGKLDIIEASLTTIEGDTTSLDSKIIACDTTGKATAALQSAGNATLTSSDGRLATIVNNTSAILSDLQLKADLTETQPVSLASSPLPTGAATEATLAALAAEDFASQTTLAALLTELQAKADLSETQPVSASSLPLPTGAATESTASLSDGRLATIVNNTATIAGRLPTTLGAKVSADSLSVTLATDQGHATEAKQDDIITAINNSGGVKDVVEFHRHDYSATPVTTAADTVLIASTASDVTNMQIFDSSGQTLFLKVGGANKFYIIPGGNENISVTIPSGSQISVRAVSANADSGELTINFIG